MLFAHQYGCPLKRIITAIFYYDCFSPRAFPDSRPRRLEHPLSSIEDGRAKKDKSTFCGSLCPSTWCQNFQFVRNPEISRCCSAPCLPWLPAPVAAADFPFIPFKKAKSHYRQMKRLFPWRTPQPVCPKKRKRSGKLERQPCNDKKPSGTKTWKQPSTLINRRRFFVCRHG